MAGADQSDRTGLDQSDRTSHSNVWKTRRSTDISEGHCLQDPGLEAHLVKFDHLISYVDRGENITRLKTTPTVAQALAVFLFGGLRQLSATLHLLISSSG